MKKTLIAFIIIFISLSAEAQLKYTKSGQLTLGNITPPEGYTTGWEGKGHYFHYNGSTANGTWLKLNLEYNAPRISASTSHIRFYDTDSQTYHTIYVSKVVEASDISFKTNIRSVKNSLDKIKQLNPVQYNINFQKDIINNTEDIGFIAQEIEKIIPEAVYIDDNGNKLINYRAIIPLLTGSIKELLLKMEELTKKIYEQEKQIKELTNLTNTK